MQVVRSTSDVAFINDLDKVSQHANIHNFAPIINFSYAFGLNISILH